MKKTGFTMPFAGFDKGEQYGLPYDALIGEQGNPILAFKIKNIVEQYSSDAQNYLNYHKVLLNIVNTIGENHIVQKSDIFSRRVYVGEPQEEYLQQTYSDHFDGRKFKTIETILSFTDITWTEKKKTGYKSTEAKYKDLREKYEKIFLTLKDEGYQPVYFKEKDFEHYLSSTLSMDFESEIKTFDNLKAYDTHIKVGTKFVKTISFVDIEDIKLPNEIYPYSFLGGNNATKSTPVDNFSFINTLQDYETIIYNQVLYIPDQRERQRFLANKKNKHEGFQNEAINRICADEIQDLLNNIVVDGQLIVDAHFSIMISCKSLESLEKTSGTIDNQLNKKSIRVSLASYNQLELFRTAFIGNATELKEYDLFTTTSEASLCFFFKESYPVDDDSSFYLRFSDRQGVPLKVDTSDLPMTTGRMNNRNKFVLGPSGSGKSFLMNNIVEQYLTYNYDVVIVDTGDSYSGLCKYRGGKYIQYTEEKPITMNPFLMNKEEFNIEKIEFLGNLIFLIWQGADSSMSTTQKSIIDNLLMSYYHQYFEGGQNWHTKKSNEELILYLKRYNIYEEDILSDFDKQYSTHSNYYNVLGLNMESSKEDVKRAYRRLAIEMHPDTATESKYGVDDFFRINQAYETLSDDEKRKEYDETQLAPIESRIAERPKYHTHEFDEAFRNAVVKRIVQMEQNLKVDELSFNSFYEYCEVFLPIYLTNKKYNIKDDEFNVRTFLYVLADFYKGGRYGTTLNESADNSLFNETFIVFEIDNVKDNPKLFPIVTLIIMDTFIQKMRLRKDRRKALIIEEAWKAIASKLMGGYILYLYKTVRKFWGEAVVVTQELDDIIGNPVVKDSIINNSDSILLLDQTKFIDNFDKIAQLLSLNQVEQNKIFTINNLDNKIGRGRFKEFYLKRGATGEVYGNEVSLQQYLTYTTEKPEKSAIEYYVAVYDTYPKALDQFIKDMGRIEDSLQNLVTLVNLYGQPIDDKLISYYAKIRLESGYNDIFRVLKRVLEQNNSTLYNLVNNKKNAYEEV